MAGVDKVVAIGAAMLAVGTAIGSGITWVARGYSDRKEKQKLKDEVEAANRDVESILRQFEMEASRMQKIVADISLKNPTTEAEMISLLKGHGLDPIQTEAIIRARFGSNFSRGAA
ncbi:MAG: hypothetical protein RSD49_04755 [Hafnia sp.]